MTLVLDECHHLLEVWGRLLRDVLAELPDAFVLGLTATPPDTLITTTTSAMPSVRPLPDQRREDLRGTVGGTAGDTKQRQLDLGDARHGARRQPLSRRTGESARHIGLPAPRP